ncbi:lytic transglycosylase [Rhodoferax lacus]|uniref:Lytic transglycosylase n=1 Tax=Rhodoferax lacus TaxID=2184758 RepID=A0A3E1RF89_9BURK|nr:lytic transglycosylase [Rhodoferax lacus]
MVASAQGGPSRRGVLTLLGAPALMGLPQLARAGAQIEEPLADAVRNALSTAVSSSEPPEPVFADTEARLHYLRWKVEMNQRLVARNSDLKTLQDRDEFLQTLWYNCKRTRLDVALVLGLIQVESNFRRFAVSSVGARGYMQVMPFWTRSIGDGNPNNLFHKKVNLRFGCVILRHYLDLERGDAFLALGRYNGSRGKAPYPDAVQGARRRWEIKA